MLVIPIVYVALLPCTWVLAQNAPHDSQQGEEIILAEVVTSIGPLLGIRITDLSATLLSVILLILVAVICLLLFANAPLFIHKTIPESAFFILSGALLGFFILLLDLQTVHSLFAFDQQFFFLILIPPIIFNAGYFLNKGFFFNNIGLISIYAFVGTFFSSFAIGFSLWGCSMAQIFSAEFSVFDLLLFGSLISAVDPVAVLAIFDELEVNRRLNIWVFGESVLNDGVSIVLYQVFASIRVVASDAVQLEPVVAISLLVLKIILVVIGSIIVGIIMGFCSIFLLRFTSKAGMVTLETLIIVLFAASSYFIADTLFFSGIVAILFCAIFSSLYAELNIAKKSRVTLKNGLGMIATISDTIIFLYLGISLVIHFHFFDLAFISLTLLFSIMYRFLFLFVVMMINNMWRRNSPVQKISFREQFIVAYGGLRGGVAFALAYLISPFPDFELQRRIIITTTLVVITFTIFVQGTTLKPILKLLRIKSIDKPYKLKKFKLEPHNLEFSLRSHHIQGIKNSISIWNGINITSSNIEETTPDSRNRADNLSTSSYPILTSTSNEGKPSTQTDPDNHYHNVDIDVYHLFELTLCSSIKELLRYINRLKYVYRQFQFGTQSDVSFHQISISEEIRYELRTYIQRQRRNQRHSRLKFAQSMSNFIKEILEVMAYIYHFSVKTSMKQKRTEARGLKYQKNGIVPLPPPPDGYYIYNLLVAHKIIHSSQEEFQLGMFGKDLQFLLYLTAVMLIQILPNFAQMMESICERNFQDLGIDAMKEIEVFLSAILSINSLSMSFGHVGSDTSTVLGKRQSIIHKETLVSEGVFSLMCVKVTSIVKDMIVEKKSITQKVFEGLDKVIRFICIRPLTNDERNVIDAIYILRNSEYDIYNVKLRRSSEKLLSSDVGSEERKQGARNEIEDLKRMYHIFKKQQQQSIVILQKYQSNQKINIHRIFVDGGFSRDYDLLYSKHLLLILQGFQKGNLSKQLISNLLDILYKMQECVSAPIIWKSQVRSYSAELDYEEADVNILKRMQNYIQKLVDPEDYQHFMLDEYKLSSHIAADLDEYICSQNHSIIHDPPFLQEFLLDIKRAHGMEQSL